jgi:hypothetical protein
MMNEPNISVQGSLYLVEPFLCMSLALMRASTTRNRITKLTGFILPVYLMIQFYSCKKENLIDEGITFYRTRTEVAGPIRVFVRSGELSDPSLVHRFEIQDSALINFYTNIRSLDTIRILENHTARLFQYSYAHYTYNVHFNMVKFVGKDTITSYSYLEVYTRTLYYFLAMFKPEIYKEYIVSSTAGAYNFAYRTRNEFRLLKDNDKLKSPWIVAMLHNNAFSSRAYWLQNMLDPGFHQHLGETDTVVLRENYIIYEK